MTFLNHYDLSGKVVYPFVTHGGLGEQNVVSDLQGYFKAKTYKSALVITSRNVTDTKIEAWINQ